MKLRFSSRYKSIKQFKDKELPSFSVFTGKNGAGKTHLLQAIQGGNDPIQQAHIQVEGVRKEDIRYFNYQNFKIDSQQVTQRNTIDARKGEAWEFFSRFKDEFAAHDHKLKALVGQVDGPYALDRDAVGVDSWGQYQVICDAVVNAINARRGKNPRAAALLMTYLLEGKKYLIDTEKNEFLAALRIDIESFTLEANLSEICFEYQSFLNRAKLGVGDGGFGYDDVKMQVLENRAPWSLINQMLKQFDIPHIIAKPTFSTGDILVSNPEYTCRLQLGSEYVDFSDLSSGERVLCALAVSVFQDGATVVFPKLLLLDEIDASLHPSMIKSLLGVIDDVFIKNGCDVILATHSPTTVSLVTDDALFEVVKGDTAEKIIKIDRTHAVELLSEGLMTLDKAVTFINDVFKKDLTVISEGKNRDHIRRAIELLEPDLLERIEIYANKHDGGSGDADLGGLYNFVSIVRRDQAALFVVDCDSKAKFERKIENDKTFFYIFDVNENNSIAQRGIENVYPESLFDEDFCERLPGDRLVFRKDSKNKTIFFQKKVALAEADCFAGYGKLIAKIKTILESGDAE